MELRSYGFEGNEISIAGAAKACSSANRVTYTWDDLINEWYINRSGGLEHGYTLSQRPPVLNHQVLDPWGLGLPSGATYDLWSVTMDAT